MPRLVDRRVAVQIYVCTRTFNKRVFDSISKFAQEQHRELQEMWVRHAGRLADVIAQLNAHGLLETLHTCKFIWGAEQIQRMQLCHENSRLHALVADVSHAPDPFDLAALLAECDSLRTAVLTVNNRQVFDDLKSALSKRTRNVEMWLRVRTDACPDAEQQRPPGTVHVHVARAHAQYDI